MLPFGILKYESAAACAAAHAKLTGEKRQRVNWTVEAVGPVRLKLAYQEGICKTRHSFRQTIVVPYLGDAAPKVLGPDDPGAAEEDDADEACVAAPGSAPASGEPRAAASGALARGARLSSATASGVPYRPPLREP